MARYPREYGRPAAWRPRGARRYVTSGRGSRPRMGWMGYGEEYDYDTEFGARSRYGTEYAYRHRSRGRGFGRGRLPGKAARGFPIRGIHTYDLDYGDISGGPTTDYSGRAGYDTEPIGVETPRGPYTPRLAEIGREARRRRRLYGREDWPYSGQERGGWR